MNSSLRKFVLAMAAIALIASSIGTASAYNRGGAADYARSHYSSGVPGSWYFGDNDCTNFVSHSLNAGGGIKMRTDSRYPMWWYGSIWSYSYSWVQVQQFRDFIVNSGKGIEKPFTGTTSAARPANLRIGDIIQADGIRNTNIGADGNWEHTMIITAINNNDVYVTYRSNNRVDRPISEIIRAFPNAKFRALLISDYA